MGSFYLNLFTISHRKAVPYGAGHYRCPTTESRPRRWGGTHGHISVFVFLFSVWFFFCLLVLHFLSSMSQKKTNKKKKLQNYPSPLVILNIFISTPAAQKEMYNSTSSSLHPAFFALLFFFKYNSPFPQSSHSTVILPAPASETGQQLGSEEVAAFHGCVY